MLLHSQYEYHFRHDAFVVVQKFTLMCHLILKSEYLNILVAIVNGEHRQRENAITQHTHSYPHSHAQQQPIFTNAKHKIEKFFLYSLPAIFCHVMQLCFIWIVLPKNWTFLTQKRGRIRAAQHAKQKIWKSQQFAIYVSILQFLYRQNTNNSDGKICA